MTTYTQGYRDGLEAAAKVCDEHTDWYMNRLETEYSCVSDSCADTIRKLPVPESKDGWLDELTAESQKDGFI